MLGISRVRSMTLAVIRAVRRERAAENPPLFKSRRGERNRGWGEFAQR